MVYKPYDMVQAGRCGANGEVQYRQDHGRGPVIHTQSAPGILLTTRGTHTMEVASSAMASSRERSASWMWMWLSCKKAEAEIRERGEGGHMYSSAKASEKSAAPHGCGSGRGGGDGSWRRHGFSANR